MSKNSIIRKIYLYLFSLVGLVLITIGGVQLVNLGLKTYVFTKADRYYEYPAAKPASTVPNGKTTVAEPSKEQIDEYQKNQQASQRQREVSIALSMIIIGTPLFLYHWNRIKKDQKEEAAA